MSEDKTNTISGIEQGRASFAYECANGIAKQQKEKSKLAKEYKSYAKKIPMLIKTNGLGATFAFVLSKKGKGNAYENIYDHTSKWLFEKDTKKLIPEDSKKKGLAEAIIDLDSTMYRAVTVEVLAFFNWLRRFAEGLIEGED